MAESQAAPGALAGDRPRDAQRGAVAGQGQSCPTSHTYPAVRPALHAGAPDLRLRSGEGQAAARRIRLRRHARSASTPAPAYYTNGLLAAQAIQEMWAAIGVKTQHQRRRTMDRQRSDDDGRATGRTRCTSPTPPAPSARCGRRRGVPVARSASSPTRRLHGGVGALPLLDRPRRSASKAYARADGDDQERPAGPGPLPALRVLRPRSGRSTGSRCPGTSRMCSTSGPAASL